MIDYYTILQLKPSASLSEIRTNYKKLINELRSIKDFKKQSEAISEVVEAYEILKNPIRKRKYDALIKNTISSSRKMRRSYSDSKLSKYEKTINRKALKSTNKVKPIIRKSDKRTKRDQDIGDTIFNGIELLDLILEIVFAIFDFD